MDKHHILVVDDNHINRLFFESSLKKLNLMVSLSENGYSAIEMCGQQSFDLILMDIRMDGLDGVQTATAIKSIEAHQNTPILAVSAELFKHKKHTAFTDSMLKPISQDALKSVISTYLSLSEFESIYFDEQQALKISHQDIDIVQKLRKLLVKQLPKDWLSIEYLYNNKDWPGLDACLHKLMGSAKICAANNLLQQIELFKSNIKQQYDERGYKELKSVIDQTIHAANSIKK